MRWIPCSCLLLLLVGCGDNLLVVDLRTDLIPGVEFATVTTEITYPGGDVTRSLEVTRDATFVGGARVAELVLDDSGSYDVTVRLYAPWGDEVVSRRIRVDVDGPRVVTVLIARDCRDLECPAPGGDPNATTCVAGTCASPECSEDRPDLCPMPECANDVDCSAAIPCGVPLCVLGSCLEVPDDERCGLGEICDPEMGCIEAPAPAECGLCGDVNGDGRLSVTDGLVIGNFITGNPVVAPCLESHGDVLGDGAITERDGIAILNGLFSSPLPGGMCEPCPGPCGDIDRNGTVESADSLVASEVAAGSTVVTVCALWAGDVDDSREVDVTDALQIEQLVSGALMTLDCTE